MNFREHSLIMAMILTMFRMGFRVSTHHIVKGLYLAKAARLFDVPFEFFLYRHGPYSSQVGHSIAEMRTYAAICSEELLPGVNAHFPEQRAGKITRAERDGISKVCGFIRGRTYDELERLATVAWIRSSEQVVDGDEVVARFLSLRPDVSLAEAQRVDRCVQEFLA